MRLNDSPEEAEFRAGLRAWLAENLPAEGPDRDDTEALKDWSRRLADAGYVAVHWPVEYGGRGLPITFTAITYEELARAEAPEHLNLIGLGMAGPTILQAGTEEQRRRYIPAILTGEEIWCQGFSEPGSGSDLASLQTRAVRDPDRGGWRVSGQKVWSSFAHLADRCILLARTDPNAPKHEGITYFLLDMRQEGVEVRPLRQITGDAEFNEIFVDDAFVADDDVVGEVNRGWQTAIVTLLNERMGAGFILAGILEARYRRLEELAKGTRRNGATAWDDYAIRERMDRAFADVQALRTTNHRALSELMRTGVPGPEGSITKLHWSETNQRLTKLALEILGPDAALAGADEGLGYWQRAQLRSRGNTIEAGTSEILRNIIAERVLDLPRSR